MTTIALSSDQIRLNAPNTCSNNLVVTGTINSDSGLNIGYKLPISFTTNRNININGTTFSSYDIDLTKYVKSIALDGYNIRQFRLRSWLADEDFQGKLQESAPAPPTLPAQQQAPAAAPAAIINVNDFTTWTPYKWALIDWDSIRFPSDAAIHICTVRCYMAVAMIMLYQTELRESHKRVWDELNYAWLATFSCELHTVGVELWPETGPFVFTQDQSNWLTKLLILKTGEGRLCWVATPKSSPSAAAPTASKRKATTIQ
jgi:hypothetical protein